MSVVHWPSGSSVICFVWWMGTDTILFVQTEGDNKAGGGGGGGMGGGGGGGDRGNQGTAIKT